MNRPATRAWIVEALSRYWPKDRAAIEALPIREAPQTSSTLADLHEVRLPDWAADCGIAGMILVPALALATAPNGTAKDEQWRATDWWAAATWYLSGAAERAHEDAQGPIHSYSYRLGPLDARAFDHAWVNRIALFLRRWGAQNTNRDETELLGPRPVGRIQLTHDVDALGKTIAIRFKQSAFRSFRALRLSLRGELQRARSVAASAAAFAFGTGTYDRVSEVAKADEAAGPSRSLLHPRPPTFPRPGGRTARPRLPPEHSGLRGETARPHRARPPDRRPPFLLLVERRTASRRGKGGGESAGRRRGDRLSSALDAFLVGPHLDPAGRKRGSRSIPLSGSTIAPASA
jgi:hypothetical protein